MPIRRRLSDPRGFERRVAEQRIAKQLTQVELGKEIGVSGTAVWNWENGNTFPRPAALEALAKALGTTSTYLVDGGEKPALKQVADNETTAPPSLQALIQCSRERIAALANLPLNKVQVVVDYNT